MQFTGSAMHVARKQATHICLIGSGRLCELDRAKHFRKLDEVFGTQKLGSVISLLFPLVPEGEVFE